MTLLDRYVGRIALGAFAAALVFFLFLGVLVELLNNVARYAERAHELGYGGLDLAFYLALHYARFTPVLFMTVAPFALVIGCMFTVARLQHANEVVPMLFVGRSTQRILRPMFALAAATALTMAACWQWVVPAFAAELATHETFLRSGNTAYRAVVHEQLGVESQRFYAERFDPVARSLLHVNLLVESPQTGDSHLVRAREAVWDDERRDWRLIDGWLQRHRVATPHGWLERPDLTPAVLVGQARDTVEPEHLSYTDLAELARNRPNEPKVALALHRHFTWPLANVLLLLLALPLAVHFERRSRVGRVLAAIGLCGGYLLVDLTCQSLGTRGFVHPIVAAWVPPIVFGSLGIVLFGSTRT
jgi:lipopolysaccharide export system permease protein